MIDKFLMLLSWIKESIKCVILEKSTKYKKKNENCPPSLKSPFNLGPFLTESRN